MQHHTKKPGAGDAGLRGNRVLAGWQNSSPEDSEALHVRQARRLSRTFGLPIATAGTIAELHFEHWRAA